MQQRAFPALQALALISVLYHAKDFSASIFLLKRGGYIRRYLPVLNPFLI